MNFETPKSKVFALVDERGRVTRIEGGYTLGNIADISEWTYLDEGTGDRYNLCQSHYAEGGLYTANGLCRYKLVDGQLALRTEEEIEADRAPQLAEAQRTALTAELRGTDASVLEALEGLLTATTPTDFIVALMAAADKLKDTLTDRAKLRERIEALKKEQFLIT